MRVANDWRSVDKDEYTKFCKKYPDIKISIDQWKNIIYSFNESFKTYILETGDRAKLPYGFGDFSVKKKKRAKLKVRPSDGREFINLKVDWVKTKEKGRIIYNFNHHTEGYYFGWLWFKSSARFQNVNLWWFKPTRTTSRLLAHYLKTDNKYQHIYREWEN